MLPLAERIERHRMPASAALGAHGAVHRVHRRAYRVCDGGRAGLENARLFRGDLRQRIAENGGMLQPDVRNDRRLRRADNVRCVEPPAETDLQHHRIAPLLGKVPKRHRGEDFKLRGRVLHAVRGGFHRFGGAAERRIGYVRAVNAEALVHAHKMRGRIKPRFVSRGAQDRGEHRAGRAFAVRPGDVYIFQRVLHIAQPVHQLAHPLQPQTAALPVGAMNERERFVKLHDPSPPLPAAPSARRRTASAAPARTRPS